MCLFFFFPRKSFDRTFPSSPKKHVSMCFFDAGQTDEFFHCLLKPTKTNNNEDYLYKHVVQYLSVYYFVIRTAWATRLQPLLERMTWISIKDSRRGRTTPLYIYIRNRPGRTGPCTCHRPTYRVLPPHHPPEKTGGRARGKEPTRCGGEVRVRSNRITMKMGA